MKYFELAASFTRPPNQKKFVYFCLPLNGSFGNVIFQVDTSFPAVRKGEVVVRSSREGTVRWRTWPLYAAAPGMKGRVASYVLPWVNFSVLPVTLQMQCLFLLSTTYRSHHLPTERRNRENDSRCCLCICLTTLPKCLWEGGGGWGLHWVNPTAVREPLLLSPLLVTWSLFLLSWMCVSGMCIWAHAS